MVGLEKGALYSLGHRGNECPEEDMVLTIRQPSRSVPKPMAKNNHSIVLALKIAAGDTMAPRRTLSGGIELTK